MENCQKQATLGEKIKEYHSYENESKQGKRREANNILLSLSFSYFLHLHHYHHLVVDTCLGKILLKNEKKIKILRFGKIIAVIFLCEYNLRQNQMNFSKR